MHIVHARTYVPDITVTAKDSPTQASHLLVIGKVSMQQLTYAKIIGCIVVNRRRD